MNRFHPGGTMKCNSTSILEPLESRRLLSAGQLDTAFGTGGLVLEDVGNDQKVDHNDIVLPMSDGRVVTIGTTTVVDHTSESEPLRVVVERRKADGSLDTTFD